VFFFFNTKAQRTSQRTRSGWRSNLASSMNQAHASRVHGA
jgi:hypothetical protein